MRGCQPPRIEQRREAAMAAMRAEERLIVALSGGVDSSVLLGLALATLGPERVVAVTADSPSMARRDLDEARGVARQLGARHEVVKTAELEIEAYRRNAGDRCFHCRTELFEVLGRMGRRLGIPAIAYGAIKDDEGDHRPGMRAADRMGVRAPLQQAGMTKLDVRWLAEQMGLGVSDKPASACLASRIPTGTAVTAGRLGQVEHAEEALRGLGFGQLRVRHHGEVARLELDEAGLRLLWESGVRDRVVAAVRQAGFRFVTVDLEGYRTGSLNPVVGSGGRGPNRDGGQ